MIPVWCPTCREATSHASGDGQIRCDSCGSVRPDDVPLLISQVQDVQPCRWCREAKPADHPCRGGSAEPRHGSPSDLDIPWSSA